MIRKKSPLRKKVIDLTGPDGNAYVLLAYAKSYCRELDLDVKQVQKEMTSGNYDNLVQVFEKYFGDFVILEI